MNTRRTLLACSIVFAALFMRLVSLTRNGLWVDEAYSVAVAKLPVPDLITASTVDPHPPVYYLALHAWMPLLGSSEFAVRLLSVFVGVLTVALVYCLGCQVLGTPAGLLAAWLAALSPALIEYSQETRMYEMLGLLTLLLMVLALRIGDQAYTSGRRRRYLLYGAYLVVGAVGLYVHFFFLFGLLAANVWALMRSMIDRDWKWYRRWIILQILVCVPFMLWIPVLLYQLQNFVLSWISRPTLASLLNTVTYLSSGFADLNNSGLAGVISFIVAGVIGWTVFHLIRSKKYAETALLLIWAAVPLLTVFVLSQSKPVYGDKQFIFTAPAWALLLAGGIASRPRLAVVAAVALPLIYWTPLNQLYFEKQKQEWRELARYIQVEAGANDVIFLNPFAGRVAVDYYLQRPLAVTGYPPVFDLRLGGFNGKQTTSAAVDRQFSALAAQHPHIWLIQFSAYYWDPNQNLTQWLDQHTVQEATPQFWGLDVRRYRVP